MKVDTAQSHDGIALKYGVSIAAEDKPWLTFIIPFGLQLAQADAFFEHFKAGYNLLTWEARSILAAPDYQLGKDELSVDNHVSDLMTLLERLNISRTKIVGYCSGAGIALAAASRHSAVFSELVLVNGEFTLLKAPSCATQFGQDIDSLLPIAAANEKSAQFILDRMQFGKDNDIPDGIHLPFSKAHYLRRYAVNYLSYRDTDFSAMAQTIKQPTFLIAGERDEQTNVNSANQIKQLIENSTIYVDPQGDHYGAVRANSNTLAQISQYFNRQSGKQ